MGHWDQDEPHPSKLRIPTGHYGLYFGLFSQELRKEEKRSKVPEKGGFLVVFAPESLQPVVPEFVISQANQRILNDIQTLRSVTRNLLSTLAILKPKRSLKQLYQLRTFSTSAPIQRHKQLDRILDFVKEVEPAVSKEESAVVPESDQVDETDDFEESFFANQTSKINHIFFNHSDPAELNTIYPIYQSLKRNDLDLPSVENYNLVLKSICLRPLDSEGTSESIEAKLTSLLTVYQDLLEACSRNNKLHPNAETYNTILPCIFDGALKTLELSSGSDVTSHKYGMSLKKAMDYVQVGTNLFMSIKNKSDLDFSLGFPDLLACLLAFPHVLTPELCSLIVSYSNVNSNSYELYRNLIALAKHFTHSETLGMDKKQLYGYVSSVYGTYKEQLATNSRLALGEFEVYEAMIETLVSCGNIPVATKFLDQILIDFKDQMVSGKSARIPEISGLISSYLEAVMSSERTEDLFTSFNLLLKFREIAYLPEVSANVYNNMINRFIHLYSQQEYEKVKSANPAEIAEQQVATYKKIWHLYNYAVVRQDFQYSTCKNSKLSKSVSCRDSLLSLTLDLGDHPMIARLIKEILVKDHLITDWNISKKLYQYLCSGAITHGNEYYHNLLWAVVEQQAQHYSKDSTELNSFLSEHVAYLVVKSPQSFSTLLNLMMVFNAFENFKLLSDNAYGLMEISTFLTNESLSRQLSATETVKILQYQACLINEFEDPDNHYTELCPELQELKLHASDFFISLFKTLESGSKLTRDILQACSMLGLDGNFEAGDTLSAVDFKLDLSSQLNVKAEAGIESFLTYFSQGFSFTDETWNAIITQNFAMEILENESYFLIGELITRLSSSQNADAHIAKLIRLYNDKVSIKVVQSLVRDEQRAPLLTNKVLSALSAHASLTTNKYFLNHLASNVEYFWSLNQDQSWLAQFFNKFNASGMSSVVTDFLVAEHESIARLDIAEDKAADLISAITDALLNEKQSEAAGQLFEKLFSGPSRGRALLESNKLLGCLLNYYIANGAHKTVTDKFGKFKGRSVELDHLFQFSELLSTLQGESTDFNFQIRSEESLALNILTKTDVMTMKEIYENHSLLIANKSEFFDLMVTTLTKAATLVSVSCHRHLISRFESVIKLCKVLKLKQLGAISLLKILRLLAITKSLDLLNIIFNKFLVNNTIVSTFNLYFLRIKLSSEHESKMILREFSSALEQVGDKLNMSTINSYTSRLAAI